MLVELAVGDAYGAGFECVPEKVVRTYNSLEDYIQHKWHKLRPGCYTDDTQMSLAIAETLVSGEAWTADNLADRFVSTFQRDPREGYSRGMYRLLQQARDGCEFRQLRETGASSSGAAMRAGPIGVLPDRQEVIDRCTLQAAVTHNTPDGIRAAVASSLMTHYFLHEAGPRQELPEYLARHVPGDWTIPWEGEVGSQGLMSVRAAVTAVAAHGSLSEILRACVDFTGDVDTVAAIALGAAACAGDIVHDLPAVLLEGLENGPFGRDYVREIDGRLLQLAGGGTV